MIAVQEVGFEGAGKLAGRGVVAWPEGPGPHPGVLVLHEILGLNDDMRRIAERFAEAGYAAFAPDFFGEGNRIGCIARAIRSLQRRDGPVFARLEAARGWLAEHERVDAARIGAAGFCMGGGFALLFAARAPIEVVGTFYGDVPHSADALRGVPPCVAGFGGRDRIFGAGSARLRSHLDALAVPHDVRDYPDAGHSYMSHHEGWTARLGAWSPMRAGYDPSAAEDSWRRMLAFFGARLAPRAEGNDAAPR